MSEAPRIAVVTGANQGIGRAIVKGLHARMSRGDVVYLTAGPRTGQGRRLRTPGRDTLVRP